MYATGFATEVARLVPMALFPLFDCYTLFKHISTQLRTTLTIPLKFLLNSSQVVWNALLAFLFLFDNDSICQQLSSERIQVLGSVLTPGVGLLDFQVNISYLLYKLAHFYPTHSMWMTKFQELLEFFASPPLNPNRLTRVEQHLLLAIHKLVSFNTLCRAQLQSFEKKQTVEFITQILNSQRIHQLKLNPIFLSYDRFRTYEKIVHFTSNALQVRLIYDGEDAVKQSIVQILSSLGYDFHHLPDEQQGELIACILDNVVEMYAFHLTQNNSIHKTESIKKVSEV